MMISTLAPKPAPSIRIGEPTPGVPVNAPTTSPAATGGSTPIPDPMTTTTTPKGDGPIALPGGGNGPTGPTSPPHAPSGDAPLPKDDGAPGAPKAPADENPAKAAAEKLLNTGALEAFTQVGDHLTQLAKMKVGGGTPEGTESAKAATALLTDASVLLQQADSKLLEQLHAAADQVHLRLMASSTDLAVLGGQLAVAGSTKHVVNVGEVAQERFGATAATMQAAIELLAPVVSKGGGDAPAPAPKDGEAPDRKSVV